VAMFTIARWGGRWVSKLFRTKDDELFTILFFGLAVAFGGIGELLGVTDAIGAFLIGLVLGATKYRARIEQFSLPLRDVFGAFFFLNFGLVLDIGTFGEVLAPVAGAVVLTIVLNVVAGQFVAWLNKMGPQAGINATVILQNRGEFALILATLSLSAGLDERIVPFAGLYVLTMSIIGPILAVVGVFGVARAFASPAIRALAPTLVEPLALPRLIALYSLSWQAGLIAGPVVGAFLYAVGPTWSFGFTMLCAALGAVGLLTISPHPVEDGPAVGGTRRSRRPGWREALEGLTLIRRSPVLLGTISLDLFAVLFGGAVALLPVIAERRLGVGVVGLGWLRAAVGIGAAVMTGVLAMRPLRRRIGPTLFVVVAIFGVATIGLGLTRNFAVAVLCLLVLSASDAVSVFIRATLVPLVTPDAWRGRVSAVENVFIGASNELGAFESGLAGQWLGAAGAVVTGGVATLVVVGVWWVVFPAIGRIDRFEDVEMATLPPRV